MSIRIGAENHPLFDQVQAALKGVAEQAAAREAAVTEQALAGSESWAAWQSRWLEDLRRLTDCLESIRASKQRAEDLVGEADRELERVEAALQEWMQWAKANARSQ